MRELLELQTGQVAFISGLMSGFSLSIAVQILRYGINSFWTQVCFLLFLLCSLLFLLSLYIDVRLSIELAGFENLADEILLQVQQVRVIGTSSATVALCLFILAIGSLGWTIKPAIGVVTTAIVAIALFGFWFIWIGINDINAVLSTLSNDS